MRALVESDANVLLVIKASDQGHGNDAPRSRLLAAHRFVMQGSDFLQQALYSGACGVFNPAPRVEVPSPDHDGKSEWRLCRAATTSLEHVLAYTEHDRRFVAHVYAFLLLDSVSPYRGARWSPDAGGATGATQRRRAHHRTSHQVRLAQPLGQGLHKAERSCCLCRFLYGGRVDINDDTVASMLAVSSFLGIEALARLCAEYVLHHLSASNIWTFTTIVTGLEFGAAGNLASEACKTWLSRNLADSFWCQQRASSARASASSKRQKIVGASASTNEGSKRHDLHTSTAAGMRSRGAAAAAIKRKPLALAHPWSEGKVLSDRAMQCLPHVPVVWFLDVLSNERLWMADDFGLYELGSGALYAYLCGVVEQACGLLQRATTAVTAGGENRPVSVQLAHFDSFFFASSDFPVPGGLASPSPLRRSPHGAQDVFDYSSNVRSPKPSLTPRPKTHLDLPGARYTPEGAPQASPSPSARSSSTCVPAPSSPELLRCQLRVRTWLDGRLAGSSTDEGPLFQARRPESKPGGPSCGSAGGKSTVGARVGVRHAALRIPKSKPLELDDWMHPRLAKLPEELYTSLCHTIEQVTAWFMRLVEFWLRGPTTSAGRTGGCRQPLHRIVDIIFAWQQIVVDEVTGIEQEFGPLFESLNLAGFSRRQLTLLQHDAYFGLQRIGAKQIRLAGKLQRCVKKAAKSALQRTSSTLWPWVGPMLGGDTLPNIRAVSENDMSAPVRAGDPATIAGMVRYQGFECGVPFSFGVESEIIRPVSCAGVRQRAGGQRRGGCCVD